jgi:hypothetical protein
MDKKLGWPPSRLARGVGNHWPTAENEGAIFQLVPCQFGGPWRTASIKELPQRLH